MTDLLFRNAIVYRGGGRWERGSVAVTGGLITAIGPDAEFAASTANRVIDVQGNCLLPGFQDAHVHPLFAGTALLGIDLTPVHGREDYAELIRDYAKANPDLPVLTGAGWYGDVYPGGFPSREELDEIESARPVILQSHDGHGCWVNTRALELAGIDELTPDSVGGRIVRAADGTATGILLDTATSHVAPLIPAEDAEFLERAMLAAQHRLHSVGVTAWMDAAVGDCELGQDAFPVYRGLIEKGLLTAKVVAGLWWDRTRGLEQIPELLARRAEADQLEGLTANTVKIMQDGMIENLTAAMLEPYAGGSEGTGDSFLSPHALIEATVALDALGFQVHLHAVGDRAVRECLDVVEAARRANGPSTGRHQIAHLDLVHPDDLARFAALEVGANVQMLWARRDTEILDRKLPLIGSEREPYHFPFRSLADGGARLIAGSDWPVSDPNPLWAIYTGITRTATGEDVHAIGAESETVPLEPQQAIDFATALDAYTANAAYANGLDNVSGTIEVGKLADLVVLDADISAGTRLGSTRVIETFVSGTSVYRVDA